MHSKKVRRFLNNCSEKKQQLKLKFYRGVYIPMRALLLRHKKQIRVVFAMTELSQWKSELLYRKMLEHPRFYPVLAIIKSTRFADYEGLRSYFESKGYDYVTVPAEQTICGGITPDIIFYQQPYDDIYVATHMYNSNLRALFCHVTYSLRSSTASWATDSMLTRLCWQVYYENTLNLETYRNLNANRAVNGLATGLPVQDELMLPAADIPDPWKPSPDKKRIIFAPHHSIDPENWMQLSSFLTTGNIVLELAEKYSDRIQWAFKPHPLLRPKLEKVWGKEATDAYFGRWEQAEWSQYESGVYLGLFKHSDAMIHDCGSFTMEYLAMGKPVMYLMRSADVTKDCNEMHLRALDVHYQGNSRELIERFINIVLTGNDPLKSSRAQYVRDYLIPEGGKSACENIIDAILGKKS